MPAREVDVPRASSRAIVSDTVSSSSPFSMKTRSRARSRSGPASTQSARQAQLPEKFRHARAHPLRGDRLDPKQPRVMRRLRVHRPRHEPALVAHVEAARSGAKEAVEAENEELN